MALIIDAEMPHSCFNCPCVYREVDGRYFCRHSDGLLYPLYYPMTDGCPIIGEIPDKHGDLIEGEKVLKVLDAVLDNKEFIKIRQTLIDAVPIVVEATE